MYKRQGLPVITRSTAAIPDIVKHGVNGFLSESLEAQTYTDFICGLIDNPQLYQQISQTNHQEGEQRYTAKRVRNRLLDIYRKFKDN